MDKYALVGTQVPKVEEHHVGGDVIDRKCRRLLKAHALGHQEGVCGRHHNYFLPQTAAIQNQNLITHLQTWKEKEMLKAHLENSPVQYAFQCFTPPSVIIAALQQCCAHINIKTVFENM